MLMKRIALLILSCVAFFIAAFSQTTDSVFSESKRNGVWEKTSLAIITNNADCSVRSVLQLIWSETSQSWLNASLATFNSDASGSSKTLTQAWDPVTNTWINESRFFFIVTEAKSDPNINCGMQLPMHG